MAAAAAAIYHLNQADSFAKVAVGMSSNQIPSSSSYHHNTHLSHHHHHSMFSLPPPPPPVHLAAAAAATAYSSLPNSQQPSQLPTLLTSSTVAPPSSSSSSNSISLGPSSLNDYAQISNYKETKFYHSNNEFLSDYEKRCITLFVLLQFNSDSRD
jgi:hypothetical protein